METINETQESPLILLIADRSMLERKMLKAEMHPFFAGLTSRSPNAGGMAALGSYARSTLGLNPTGWMSYVGSPVAKMLTGPALDIGEQTYIERSLKELAGVPDAELLARLNAALGMSVPAVRIEAEEALRLYKFSQSHIPANGDFYVRHPVRKGHYIAASEFSTRFIAEKHAAFQKLAAALGAKSVTLTSFRSNQVESMFGAKVPLEELGTVVGIKFKMDKTGAIVESSSNTYGRPLGAPFIPTELKDWVQSDTELEFMAFSRMEANALSARITISTLSKQGLEAELNAKVGDSEMGASHTNSVAKTAVWEFQVEYHDLS